MGSELVLYCEIDAICILFMLIMIVNLWKSRKMSNGDSAFFYGALTIALVSFTDMMNAILSGRPGQLIHVLLWIDNAAYFILSLIAVYSMWIYIDYMLTDNRAAVDSRLVMYSLPMVVSGILTLLSVFGGYIFYVDGTNVYHRGSLHIIQQIACVLYFVLALGFALATVIFTDNVAKKAICKTVIIFCLLPCIGLVCQIAIHGSAVVWPLACAGLFVMFSSHQNSQILTDSLTGLNNRTRLMRYIADQCYEVNDSDVLTCTFFDIDNLRAINSRYGQAAGDKAISTIADILKRCVGQVEGSQFIARYTGNCFVVVSQGKQNVVIELTNIFREELDNLMNTKNMEHHISVLTGSVLFTKYQDTVDDFVKAIDDEIYRNRAEIRAHKLNVEDVIE